MGKTPKLWSRRSTSQKKKYKDDTKADRIQVGRVHPNLISGYFTPIILELAKETSQLYASYLGSLEDTSEQETDLLVPDVEENTCINNDDGSSTCDPNIGSNDTKPKLVIGEATPVIFPENYSSQFHLFTSQASIDEFSYQVLETTAYDFSSAGKAKYYKVRANAAKFERQLDEKYGFLRPVFTHPKIEQYVKFAQRKFHSTKPLSLVRNRKYGDKPPPLSLTASIMLLMMLYRGGVRKDALGLIGLFLLVGLKPWALILIVSIGYHIMEKKKGKSKGSMSTRIPLTKSYFSDVPDGKERNMLLETPVGTAYTESVKEAEELSEKYDAIVIGGDIPSLYTAALLSRAGKKVLVLSDNKDACGESMLDSSKALYSDFSSSSASKNIPENLPFNTQYSKIAHVYQQQELMAPALATTDDCQGGIRFATLGSEHDGYAYDVYSIPGLISGDYSSDENVPFVMRAGGVETLAEDAAYLLGDGWDQTGTGNSSSQSAAYCKLINELNRDASVYYMSKVTPTALSSLGTSSSSQKDSDSSSTSKTSNTGKGLYSTVAYRPALDFLNHTVPFNPHVRSVCSAIGMPDENLPPTVCAMAAHTSNFSAFLGKSGSSGYSYPIGGMRSLGKALENIIVQENENKTSGGGKVLTDVQVKELVFDTSATAEDGEGGPPKCIGVKLHNNDQTILLSDKEDGSIICAQGFLHTFLRYLPDDVRQKHGVPRGLPALSESRPKMNLLLVLDGTAAKLDLPSQDWYRLPNASLPRDEIDEETGKPKLGVVGSMLSSTADSVTQTPSRSKKDKSPPQSSDPSQQQETPSVAEGTTKFQSGSSWMKISFPSAKDPSWEERYGKISTCVVQVEADDEFVKFFDTKPRVYVPLPGNKTETTKRLIDRIMKDVTQEFPQLKKNKILGMELQGPTKTGKLSHTCHRYAASGIRPQTLYKNLYVGGSDLTVDSFSGAIVGSWMCAIAVMKYDYIDLNYLMKHITSDLQKFMEEPVNSGENNVAVWYTKNQNELHSASEEETKQSGFIGEEVTSAEPSKES